MPVRAWSNESWPEPAGSASRRPSCPRRQLCQCYCRADGCGAFSGGRGRGRSTGLPRAGGLESAREPPQRSSEAGQRSASHGGDRSPPRGGADAPGPVSGGRSRRTVAVARVGPPGGHVASVLDIEGVPGFGGPAGAGSRTTRSFWISSTRCGGGATRLSCREGASSVSLATSASRASGTAGIALCLFTPPSRNAVDGSASTIWRRSLLSR